MAVQREWLEKDYYKVLGVSESATPKEITRAYRKLARENHPDAKPDDKAAEDRFKDITAAYDVVGDPDKRKEYDEVRAMGPMAGGFGGFGGPGAPGGFGGQNVRFTMGGEDAGGLGDLLGNLFTNRGGRRSRGTGPQRGDDLEADLHLSFEDAAQGATTEVHLNSEVACSTCHGSGAEPGTTPHACPRCGGRGVLDENQGLFSFSQPCPQCGGRGTIVDTPCHVCHGSGLERRARQVKVRVPPGVADGATIRLKGRGAPGRNGGPPGDLYVHTHVAAHPLFTMAGKNLALTLPVTFSEAALGADIAVPTIDGNTVTLRLPPGTATGRTLRVRGRGVPGVKKAGDLMVTVEVAVPRKLNSAQRKAVEAFAAATDESPRKGLTE